jgi:flavin reductase (DIM6/NTAB) family NADH-FMN oxidoreductase RutF
VPRVAQSPVNFECRLSQSLQLTTADGSPVDTWLVLGEVVGIHIDETLLEDGIYQTAKAKPVLRAGGPTAYYSISETHRFDLVRPDAEQNAELTDRRQLAASVASFNIPLCR